MKLEKLNRFNKLPFLTNQMIAQLEPNKYRRDYNIKYWIKTKKLIVLKRGFYILKDGFEREQEKEKLLEYIGTKLVVPSYLSLEWVMQKYGLLTEAVYGLTFITTKTTRSFSSEIGSFNYFKIKNQFFDGFYQSSYKNFDYLSADKVKATFDFLYLRQFKWKVINNSFVESLRINWEEFEKSDFIKLEKIINKSKIAKMNQFMKIVKRKYA